ncbi:hypothetical protein [uncultured Arcticibacterium sp.]|uniref:hypothetical protein n=1 Tax=uncultured Arcticibacterium sp. TaxID=2173042 RepID=UPI0030FB9B9A
MKNILILLMALTACQTQPNTKPALDKLATEYVKLGLEIGQQDADFVDAYYGPDSLKPEVVEYEAFPKDEFLEKIISLQNSFEGYISSEKDSINIKRANYISAQLNAYAERVRIVGGETSDFDVESMALFGVEAPHYDTAHFEKAIEKLEVFLHGEGTLQERFQNLASRFVIPVEKLDTVMKAAIAEARKRTHEHYPIPENENFSLEFVNDKAWSGYNWYQGNFTSLIQINTDFPISIERVIDVGSHESYPGHHVFNMLLEENLYNKQGLIETSIYPLFSPQSLIAEGSANYGIDVAFPGTDKITFAKEVLLPLAGLDTTGITKYFNALELVGELNYAGNEVARGVLNGTMTDREGIDYLIKYGFYSPEKAKQRIAFTKKYRSYVINYNYGKDLVKNYIESKGGTADNPQKRWELFGELLSNQVLPVDLK